MFTYKEELEIHKLYPKDIKNQINILKSLYDAPYGSHIDQLIEITNLYRKTIYKYIQEINSVSDKVLGKNIIILSDKNIYKFSGNKIDFLTLRYELIESSVNMDLLKELLLSPSVNVSDFCSKYYIGESTLKKNIKIINDFYSPFEIRLKIQKNNVYMLGEEAKIRYCFTSLFWRATSGLKWPFFPLEKSKLELVTATVFQNSFKNISSGKQELFSYFLAVNILRATSKQNISKEMLPEYAQELIDRNPLKDDLTEVLAKVFFLTQNEINFIVLALYSFPEYHIFDKNMSESLHYLKNSGPKAYDSIMSFLKFAHEKHPHWSVNSKAGLEFMSVLVSSRITVDIFKEAYFNLYDLNLINYATSEFPSLLPHLQNVITSFTPNTDKSILKSLIFRFAQAYVTAFPAQDFEPQIKVLIDTDGPIYLELLIVKRVSALLGTKYNAHVYGITEAKELGLEAPDLIIATGITDDACPNTPTLYVFPQISQRDFQEILKKCDEILTNKKRSHLKKL